MSDWLESPAAIAAVDAVLARVGLEHGRRSTRAGSWKDGERLRQPKGAQSRQRNEQPAVVRRAPGVVRIDGWARFPWLRAGFSTRQGGGSTVYGEGEQGEGEQNLSWTREDLAEIVTANRRRFVRFVAGKGTVELATIRQFHSGMVRVIGRGGADGQFGGQSGGQSGGWGRTDESSQERLATADGKAVLRGDGLMTDRPGVLLGVQTADCVPVLVADTRTRAVAAFHAGWRGTLARIVERGIGTMRLRYGSRPQDLVGAIGPAIGACCFAVGEEVRFEFESQFVYAPELFSEVYDADPVREKYPLLFLTARAPGHSNIGPQTHLDLIEANRRQLLDAGVAGKNISVVGECTACARLRDGRRRYFSHRAEHGFTGRMMSVIGVVE